ncbi:MAG: hypothetical protein AAGA56_21875 [Myxococcota bacterium]
MLMRTRFEVGSLSLSLAVCGGCGSEVSIFPPPSLNTDPGAPTPIPEVGDEPLSACTTLSLVSLPTPDGDSREVVGSWFGPAGAKFIVRYPDERLHLYQWPREGAVEYVRPVASTDQVSGRALRGSFSPDGQYFAACAWAQPQPALRVFDLDGGTFTSRPLDDVAECTQVTGYEGGWQVFAKEWATPTPATLLRLDVEATGEERIALEQTMRSPTGSARPLLPVGPGASVVYRSYTEARWPDEAVFWQPVDANWSPTGDPIQLLGERMQNGDSRFAALPDGGLGLVFRPHGGALPSGDEHHLLVADRDGQRRVLRPLSSPSGNVGRVEVHHDGEDALFWAFLDLGNNFDPATAQSEEGYLYLQRLSSGADGVDDEPLLVADVGPRAGANLHVLSYRPGDRIELLLSWQGENDDGVTTVFASRIECPTTEG